MHFGLCRSDCTTRMKHPAIFLVLHGHEELRFSALQEAEAEQNKRFPTTSLTKNKEWWIDFCGKKWLSKDELDIILCSVNFLLYCRISRCYVLGPLNLIRIFSLDSYSFPPFFPLHWSLRTCPGLKKSMCPEHVQWEQFHCAIRPCAVRTCAVRMCAVTTCAMNTHALTHTLYRVVCFQQNI